MLHSTNNWVDRRAGAMRGAEIERGMFSYVSLENRVPCEHSLRRVRAQLDEALEWMRPDFERVYASGGHSSIASERPVRALVPQVLYSNRSERLLIEQLDYNLLFR
jgi:transposase